MMRWLFSSKGCIGLSFSSYAVVGWLACKFFWVLFLNSSWPTVQVAWAWYPAFNTYLTSSTVPFSFWKLEVDWWRELWLHKWDLCEIEHWKKNCLYLLLFLMQKSFLLENNGRSLMLLLCVCSPAIWQRPRLPVGRADILSKQVSGMANSHGLWVSLPGLKAQRGHFPAVWPWFVWRHLSVEWDQRWRLLHRIVVRIGGVSLWKERRMEPGTQATQW